MKTTIVALIAAVVMFSAGAGICAESESLDKRPYMGVLLDPAPLPGLLNKHLGLPIGQGLRIQNVLKDGPADKAGLERDDLIIGFQGKDVHNYEGLVEAIRQAGTGTKVSLLSVHLGVRKTVKLTLIQFEAKFDWKYPSEPEAIQSWRPGRFFRLRPGDDDWIEMFKDGVPPDVDVDVRKLFFDQVRIYHFSLDCVVTVKGDPYDEDTAITVRIGDEEYTSKVKSLDKLPKKFREAAENAIEKARKSPARLNRRFYMDVLPWWTPPDWKGPLDRLHPRNIDPTPYLDRGKEMLDKVQKQMRELQKRLEEQEQRYRERLEKLEKYYDRLSPKPEEKGPTEPEESV